MSNRTFLLSAGTLILLLVFFVWWASKPVAINERSPMEQSLPFPRTATQFSSCTASGALPDPECTPGAVFPDITKEHVCVSGYSSTVREVSQSIKEKSYAMYGITHRSPGQYQVDHLVSLTLGGSNEMANLWPQPGEPRPGYNEKNILTNVLRRMVCDGKMSLAEAQRIIAIDWVRGYRELVLRVK